MGLRLFLKYLVSSVLTTADRICYLPQHIGYHYYVNSKSIVQSYDKQSRTVVEYCQGIATTVDEFYRRGVDPNEPLESIITRRLFQQTVYEPAMSDASFTMSPWYYLNDEDADYGKLAAAAIHDAGIYRLYTDIQITVKKIKYDVIEVNIETAGYHST